MQCKISFRPWCSSYWGRYSNHSKLHYLERLTANLTLESYVKFSQHKKFPKLMVMVFSPEKVISQVWKNKCPFLFINCTNDFKSLNRRITQYQQEMLVETFSRVNRLINPQFVFLLFKYEEYGHFQRRSDRQNEKSKKGINEVIKSRLNCSFILLFLSSYVTRFWSYSRNWRKWKNLKDFGSWVMFLKLQAPREIR